MKKMLSLALLGAGLFSMTATTPVIASDQAGALSVTVGGGYDGFSTRRHLDNTGVPYLSLGYDFDAHWGIEALAGVFRTHFEKPYYDDKHTNGNLYLVSVAYNLLPFHCMAPYFLAGVGMMGIERNKTDANNQGNVNVGAGVKFWADSVVSLRVEAREIYTIVGGKSDVFVNGGVTFYWDMY